MAEKDIVKKTLEAYNDVFVDMMKLPVEKAYKGTDKWMKAPNGEPTKRITTRNLEGRQPISEIIMIQSRLFKIAIVCINYG